MSPNACFTKLWIRKSKLSFLPALDFWQVRSMRFYVASKVKHAEMWRGLRERGFPIIASWIDEADEGQSEDYRGLAVRCIDEATRADGVIVYAAPGDRLKGALVECGAALAAGRPVFFVGDGNVDFSRVFIKHPLCFRADTVKDAFLQAMGVQCAMA